MKRSSVLLVILALITVFLATTSASAQTDASITEFWNKFKAAVIKGDKTSVSDLSQFPIGMPYGAREVRSRAQLLRRYREIFNGEADAAKCFREAKPMIDPATPREFSVSCKMKGGGDEEPVVFSFTRSRFGWRFNGLDNINE